MNLFGHGKKKIMELDEQSFRYLLCAFGNFTGVFTGTEREIETVCVYKYPIEAQFFGQENPHFMKLLEKNSLVVFAKSHKVGARMKSGLV